MFFIPPGASAALQTSNAVGIAASTGSAANQAGSASWNWGAIAGGVGDTADGILDIATKATPAFMAYKMTRQNRNKAIGRRNKRKTGKDGGAWLPYAILGGIAAMGLGAVAIFKG